MFKLHPFKCTHGFKVDNHVTLKLQTRPILNKNELKANEEENSSNIGYFGQQESGQDNHSWLFQSASSMHV